MSTTTGMIEQTKSRKQVQGLKRRVDLPEGLPIMEHGFLLADFRRRLVLLDVLDCSAPFLVPGDGVDE